MVRNFRRAGGGSSPVNSGSGRYGNSKSYANINSISKDLSQNERVQSAAEYAKALGLLDKTLTLGLGINRPNKVRQLNDATWSSVNDGFHRALKLLHKDSVGHMKTAYGFNEQEYDTEILANYHLIFSAFETFEDSKDTFDAQAYKSTFESLINLLHSSYRRNGNKVLLDALNFLRDSFSNGLISFYEKEGLSNPVNIANFFRDNGCLTFINVLLPDSVDVDPSNPEHNTLLLVAFDLYLLDTAKYSSNPNEFNVALHDAFSRFGSIYVPVDSPEGIVRDKFDQFSSSIDNAFQDDKTLEGSFDILDSASFELANLEKIGSHIDKTTSPHTFNPKYTKVLEEVSDAASGFNKLKLSITRLVDTMNSSLTLTPPININEFIDPTPKRIDFKDVSNNPQHIEYPNLKFRDVSEFRDIVKNISIPSSTPAPSSRFESLDAMTMSISMLCTETEFANAGINNPSQKSLDLVTSSRIVNRNLKTKIRAATESYGDLSQKLQNVDIPLKTLTFEESLTFAIQDVLKHHPDIDANVLREACQAHDVQHFDTLITKSKRMLNPEAIARLVSTLQVIYSGDFKSLDEKGKECILAISKTGFARLQRQIDIYSKGFANYKAVLALSEIDSSAMSTSERIKFLLNKAQEATSHLDYTSSIISQGISSSDSLFQMAQSNRNYSDHLIRSGIPFREYEKLQKKSGYRLGSFGNYSKVGYRTRRFTRGTTNVVKGTAKGAYEYILKPFARATLGTIDWLSGNNISHYGGRALNYIIGKKK
ncbi:hypothetical protein HOJ01_03325 [bacterium]|jgi:hypothetical protein|nr:hypothetical protein [bacterium]